MLSIAKQKQHVAQIACAANWGKLRTKNQL